jgi:peptide methionine sulfoxide reductase msrA/msrB
VEAFSAWCVPTLVRDMSDSKPKPAEKYATALLAGGCFWCVVADLQKVPGVIAVVPGYSGGKGENPTYETYATLGHREVVEVTYDPSALSFEALITYFLKHIDPTDGSGSFYDRGVQYAPAIYCASDEEREIAERVLAAVDAQGIFDKPLAVTVESRAPFWPAEEYHRDYHTKAPKQYAAYRKSSGRDAFKYQSPIFSDTLKAYPFFVLVTYAKEISE